MGGDRRAARQPTHGHLYVLPQIDSVSAASEPSGDERDHCRQYHAHHRHADREYHHSPKVSRTVVNEGEEPLT